MRRMDERGVRRVRMSCEDEDEDEKGEGRS